MNPSTATNTEPRPAAGALDTRRRATELVIGAALCLGGYLALVDPADKELAAVRAQVAALRQGASTGAEAGDDSAALRGAIARTQTQGSAAQSRSRLVTDEARLLATVTDLATQHGVRLEQLAPISAQAGAKPADAAAQLVSRANFQITATGRFSSVAAFVAAIQREAGLCAVRGLVISPDLTPGSTDVVATIETEHAVLTLPAAATLAPAPATAPAGPASARIGAEGAARIGSADGDRP